MNYFIFSQKQKQRIAKDDPSRKTMVFNGKEYVEYTECNSTGKSYWDDAVVIGQFPESAMKVH